jgi:hypothetical protein
VRRVELITISEIRMLVEVLHVSLNSERMADKNQGGAGGVFVEPNLVVMFCKRLILTLNIDVLDGCDN